MDADERNLVQPEGVNAGSAKSASEGHCPHGDVRPGGHPEWAEQQADQTEDDEIVDAPFLPRDRNAPSLEQSVEEGAR